MSFEKSGVAGEFLSRAESGTGPNTITVRRNGVEVHYKVDPDVYQAMVMSGNVALAKPIAKLMAIIAAPHIPGQEVAGQLQPTVSTAQLSS